MKNVIAFSALVAAMLASFGAHAGNTTELKVTGLIKPAACKPNFDGGGAVDYGVIPAARLTPGAYTKLETRQISLNVSCDSAAKIGLIFQDNRAASMVAGIIQDSVAVSEERYNYGLGTVNGKNVGGYMLAIAPETTADSKQVSNIYAMDGSSWGDAAKLGHDGTVFSFASSGGSQPLAIKTLNARINVTAVLNKPENLNLTQEVPLDGSATIEIKYL